jgi:hypothetical protein
LPFVLALGLIPSLISWLFAFTLAFCGIITLIPTLTNP